MCFSLGMSTVGAVGAHAGCGTRESSPDRHRLLKTACLPHLHGPCPPQDDADESLVWPVPGYSKGLVTDAPGCIRTVSTAGDVACSPIARNTRKLTGGTTPAADSDSFTWSTRERSDAHPTRARGELNDANRNRCRARWRRAEIIYASQSIASLFLFCFSAPPPLGTRHSSTPTPTARQLDSACVGIDLLLDL